MKKLTTFASDVRVNALIACSAAVLLTACGGGASDTAANQATQTAGYSYNSGVVADASTAADSAETTPAVEETAAVSNAGFDLAGYGAHPLTADADPQAAPTFAADGTPKLLSSSVAIDVTAAATVPTTSINY